ncbi:3-carboxy-cis,cis-muconate cycloisomerase [Litoreibacter albidus]|uniref:3-carboxy-cis,cis-muconate cycloisomerase n=1 Tax=Litoreibacter albidus TaxID=670155 RepID=UPI0037352244
MNPLTSTNRLFAPLLTDDLVAERFSTSRTIADFNAFEAALLDAQAETGHISETNAAACKEAVKQFTPDIDAIADCLISDGLPVPEYVRQLKAVIGAPHASAFHRDVTSQDIIDSSFAMACRDINHELTRRLEAIIASLDLLSERFGANPLTGRTRMQAALPMTVAQRIAPWRASMAQALSDLAGLRPQIEVLQLGGPVGLYHEVPQSNDHAQSMAKSLDLSIGEGQWHTQRSNVAKYANWLSQVTGGLGKVGLDIGLMAQQGINAVTLADGGSSSAMPHKRNPVLAEVLVALANHNAGQLGLVHQALVHEQERSGMAWTLEWMTVPGMMSSTARALSLGQKLVSGIKDIGDPHQ